MVLTHISRVFALQEQAAFRDCLADRPLPACAAPRSIRHTVILERLALFLQQHALQLFRGKVQPVLAFLCNTFGLLQSSLIARRKVFGLRRLSIGRENRRYMRRTCFRFLSTSLTNVANSSLISFKTLCKTQPIVRHRLVYFHRRLPRRHESPLKV